MAAPCRHFNDRDALIADVALRGFERFEADLTMAWNDGKPNPMLAFENVGKAYLAFAKAEPAFYSAMFESGLPLETHTGSGAGQRPGFRDAAGGDRSAVCAELPLEQRPPSMMMSLHFWAITHGIAALFGRGDAVRRNLPMSPQDMPETGTLTYLQGLGLGDEPDS